MAAGWRQIRLVSVSVRDGANRLTAGVVSAAPGKGQRPSCLNRPAREPLPLEALDRAVLVGAHASPGG
jgi:hypothetical protein